ncbi:MAG: putative zinc-binding protein [bacterium]
MAERKPLVFACAGCSFAGKLAYDLAREIDRRGDAEMSCLAGVGAKHPSFLRKLKGREAWIIDGCPIECAGGVFKQVERDAQRHIKLHELGFKKNFEPEGGVDISRLAEHVAHAQTEVPTMQHAGATANLSSNGEDR